MDSQDNDVLLNAIFENGSDDLLQTTQESIGMSRLAQQTQESIPIVFELTSKEKKTVRGQNFTDLEDSVLVSAWLNTSLDNVRSNEQKSTKFWGRILTYYTQSLKKTNLPLRTERSLINRWSLIQHAVNKFSGYLAQIEKAQPFGAVGVDKIDMAHKMFQDIQKTGFQFKHCWKILKDEPKWLDFIGQLSSKKKQSLSSPINLVEENSNSNEGNAKNSELPRPIGKKAEKERTKKLKGDDKMEVWVQEKRKMQEEKMKISDQKMKMCAQDIDMAKKRLEMQEREEDVKIMMSDTSTLPPARKDFFESLQEEIVAKRRRTS